MARQHEDWISTYMKYSGFGEAPAEVNFWTGVACVAGSLRRNVWLDMGYFRWYANHYIVLVAPPGIIGKTTTMNVGLNLLREVPGIKLGPSAITWQAFVKLMAESREDVAFPDGSFIPACCLTSAIGELGNFINMEDSEMLNVLIDMYDAQQAFEKKTKVSGDDFVTNPWFNFIACTTPAWIASGFSDLTTQGGFVSRCLFVFADKKRDYIAYPKRKMPPNLADMGRHLVDDLARIGTLRGEFEMTEEAYEYGEELYRTQWNGSGPQHAGFDAGHGGYWARKQAHLHKLAMVLSASEGASMRLEKRHLESAMAHLGRTEANLNRVFELIGRTPDSRLAAEILTYLGRLGTCSRQDLTAHFMARYGKQELDRGIDTVIAAGKCRLLQLPDGPALTVRAGRVGGSPQTPGLGPSASPPQTPAAAPASGGSEVTLEPIELTVPSREEPPR